METTEMTFKPAPEVSAEKMASLRMKDRFNLTNLLRDREQYVTGRDLPVTMTCEEVARRVAGLDEQIAEILSK